MLDKIELDRNFMLKEKMELLWANSEDEEIKNNSTQENQINFSPKSEK